MSSLAAGVDKSRTRGLWKGVSSFAVHCHGYWGPDDIQTAAWQLHYNMKCRASWDTRAVVTTSEDGIGILSQHEPPTCTTCRKKRVP